ncbi:uncharacterized protein PRCAT00006003001 [Priceomyces carsonii]|uniref:uncharacterized protein n=1 Tax=Priceomyces carsonii TaxID=28549 RepID=UPI002EDB3508|nr:unnamed protein product [Priceomyces carsonii]
MIRYRLKNLRFRRWNLSLVRKYSVIYKDSYRSIPDFETLEDLNKINSAAFDRLSKAYKLLKNQKPFKNTVLECHTIYKLDEASFLEDLMKYPRINQDMIKFLMTKYPKSNSVRSLILDDLKTLVLSEKYDTFLNVIGLLREKEVSNENISFDLQGIDSSHHDIKSQYANILVKQAIDSGENTLGAAYAIDFTNNNLVMSNETISNLLQSFTFDTNINHTFNSFTILKILQKLVPNISAEQKCVLLDYFLEADGPPYFANIFYDKYMSNTIECLQAKPGVIHKFIRQNLKYRNTIRAFNVWSSAKEMHNISLTIRAETICQLLKCLRDSKDSSVELAALSEIPSELFGSDRLVDFLLEFYGTESKYTEEFEALVNTLSAPLRRLTLSLLFAAFIFKKYERRSERVLQYIFESKNGMNERDYNVVINKLLEEGNLEKCIEMIEASPAIITRLASVNILLKVLRFEESTERESLLLRIIKKLNSLVKDEESTYLVTKEIIIYVTKNISNRVGRSLLTRITQMASNNSSMLPRHSLLNVDQYHLPKEIVPFLIPSAKLRVDCLYVIIDQSIIVEDLETIKWCIEELRLEGILVKDILISLSNKSLALVDQILYKN